MKWGFSWQVCWQCRQRKDSIMSVFSLWICTHCWSSLCCCKQWQQVKVLRNTLMDFCVIVFWRLDKVGVQLMDVRAIEAEKRLRYECFPLCICTFHWSSLHFADSSGNGLMSVDIFSSFVWAGSSILGGLSCHHVWCIPALPIFAADSVSGPAPHLWWAWVPHQKLHVSSW